VDSLDDFSPPPGKGFLGGWFLSGVVGFTCTLLSVGSFFLLAGVFFVRLLEEFSLGTGGWSATGFAVLSPLGVSPFHFS